MRRRDNGLCVAVVVCSALVAAQVPLLAAASGPKTSPAMAASLPTPKVTSLSPPFGPTSGQTRVVIKGELAGATQVRFGDLPAGELRIVSPAEISALAPPSRAGTVDVTVVTDYGTTPREPHSRFTYISGAWTQVDQKPAFLPQTATVLDGPACRQGRPKDYCGKILVAQAERKSSSAGYSDLGPFWTQLYDPGSASWSGPSPLPQSFLGGTHSAILLDGAECTLADAPAYCGKVLLVSSLGSVLYDPGLDVGLPTGPLVHPGHVGASATLLNDPLCASAEAPAHCGHVLLAGGRYSDGELPVEFAQVFDPDTLTWTPTEPLPEPRGHHSAVVLAGPRCEQPERPDYCGKVLVTGGVGLADAPPPEFDPALDDEGRAICGVLRSRPPVSPCRVKVLRTSLLYDPEKNPRNGLSGGWEEAADLASERAHHAAFLLADGRVVVAGGNRDQWPQPVKTDDLLASTEIFDPSTSDGNKTASTRLGRWTASDQMLSPRAGATLVPMASGKLLAAGGSDIFIFQSNTRVPALPSELFDATVAGNGDWNYAPALITSRDGHVATELGGSTCSRASPPSYCGSVLVLGGRAGIDQHHPLLVETMEIFSPAPAVTAVHPRASAAQEPGTVTVEGSGFHRDVRVLLGDVEVSEDRFTVDSMTKITIDPPARAPSTVEIEVVDPEGGSSRGLALNRRASFTYLADGPAAVAALTAKALSDSQVMLSFKAPTIDAGDDLAPPATEYVVKRARSPISTPEEFEAARSLCGGVCTFDPPPQEVGDGLVLTVKDLFRHTTYHFAIRAKAADKLGPPASVSVKTLGDDLVPGAVTDLAAGALDHRKLELSFSAPPEDAGVANSPPAKDFVIKQSAEPITAQRFASARSLCETSCSFAPADTGDELSLEVKDLDPDTTYYYALKAVDESGQLGAMSNVASATTLRDTIAPAAVTDLSVEAMSHRKVQLSFSAVADDSGEGRVVEDYVIKQSRRPITEESFSQARPLCDTSCRFSPSKTGDRLTLEVTGLTASTTYHYAIRARDEGANLGAFERAGSTAKATTLEDTIAPGRVERIGAKALSATEIRLVFAAVGSDGAKGPPVARYIVVQSNNPIDSARDFRRATRLCGRSCSFAPDDIGARLQLKVTELAPGRTYHYAIRAIDEAGNKAKRSRSVAATTKR